MKENKGLTLISLAVTIIIMLILAGVTLNVVIGENGILTKATKVEVSFNKGEILEELNVRITEKYLDAYGKATQNGQNNLKEFYDADKVIKFLEGYSGGETGNDFSGDPDLGEDRIIIEDLNGHTQTTADSRYFIILEHLNKKMEKYGKGTNASDSTDYFYIQGSNGVYKVIYRNSDNEDEEIGELQIQQPLPG